jgi:uncharacterized protein (TIGR02246 family)
MAANAFTLRRQFVFWKLKEKLSDRIEQRRKMADNGHTIFDLVRQLEEAWNRGDSKKFASAFADDADFITIFGMHYNGRQQVDSNHRRIFDTIYKGSINKLTLESVRFIRPDVVLAFIRAVLELDGGRTLVARPTLVLTKEHGKWAIAALQNTAVSEGQP